MKIQTQKYSLINHIIFAYNNTFEYNMNIGVQGGMNKGLRKGKAMLMKNDLNPHANPN